MNKTSIEWTDFTSNPIKFRNEAGTTVGACVKVSPGCAHCYAERITLRYDRGQLFNAANMEKLTVFLDEKELHELLTRKTCGGIPVGDIPPGPCTKFNNRVFIGDMTDIFGEWVPFELLDRLFAVFALRPDVTFQVLTKRARRMREYFSTPNRHTIIDAQCYETRRVGHEGNWTRDYPLVALPLPNVWLGVSVEDQPNADARLPALLATPAAVRFVSYEPALGPVQFRMQSSECRANGNSTLNSELRTLNSIDWLIAGGESGPNARPMHPDWARSARDQCQAVGVAFFFKQWGEHAPRIVNPPSAATGKLEFPDKEITTRVGRERAGRLLDGREWNEFPTQPGGTHGQEK